MGCFTTIIIRVTMESTTDVYDVAIIGAGMIGSSAVKYMSEDSYSVKTILIGPSEPQSGIHGAWFDEGRITRKLDKNHVWRNLGRYVIQCSRYILNVKCILKL